MPVDNKIQLNSLSVFIINFINIFIKIQIKNLLSLNTSSQCFLIFVQKISYISLCTEMITMITLNAKVTSLSRPKSCPN